MIGVLLGLVVAAAFGSGDFAGGRASRSTSTAAVLIVASACSVAGAGVVAFLVDAEVTSADLGFGALAGVLNVGGLALLYRGLARNAARVVAPVTAAVASLVPVGWGLATGERPGALVLAGIALEVVAVVLLAREPAAPGERIGVAEGAAPAVLAGALLGSSLVLFAQTGEASGQWPVLAARLAALVVVACGAAGLARTQVLRLPRGEARRLAVLAGLLDVAATSLLLVAVRRDLLVVVAPIAALGPAFTVLLARVWDQEHIDRVRQAGLGLALVGLVLVAAG